VAGVLLVDQPHQGQVLRRLGGRLVVQRRAVQPQQLTLPADAQLRLRRLDQPPLPLNRQAQLFFEPLQLHLEPADLLEQLGLDGLGIDSGGLEAVGEHPLGAVEQLLLPGVDQGGVDAVLAGQLVDRPLPLQGRQRDLGLERRRVLLPSACHCFPFPGPPQ
jgi:hypothetical protein